MAHIPDAIEELRWRGLLHQHTKGVDMALRAAPTSVYCGFDPTAPSLHVGNLVPVMGLAHMQRAGHRPIALVGGGTGLIGDPSGKRAERQLNSADVVRENSAAIAAQLGRFLDFSGAAGVAGALMRDNAEWLLPLSAVDFMRDVGKHFTLNYMLAKDSVKSRMDEGISYTEFSYMLLQAYDFLELSRRDGVTVQLGGSDQWGNITAGLELVRRVTGSEAHAVTLPLVTTAAGTKFGKTEAGSVWLDAARTSPYSFYQFWINADDRDVGRYLRFFTLLSRQEIEALEADASDRPERRDAQQALALDVTARVHGSGAARVAEEASGLLFGRSDPRTISEAALVALRAEVPHVALPDGEDATVVDLLVRAGLAQSRGAARRLVEQGGVYLNGARADAATNVAGADRLAGGHLLLRKGARDYAVVSVGGD